MNPRVSYKERRVNFAPSASRFPYHHLDPDVSGTLCLFLPIIYACLFILRLHLNVLKLGSR